MRRHLICLIDGTRVSASQVREYEGYSNVYELGYMLRLRDRSDDGKPQIVFYSSGISSQPDTKDVVALATGRTIRAQILDQYTNLCANYNFSNHTNPEACDKIYIFGFSRGAMAARALAGLIMDYGLLKPEDVRYAPRIVDDWENRNPLPGPVDLHSVEVEFIGLFDAVMGGIEAMRVFNPVRFPNATLSEKCSNGIHILAVDEDRALFKNRSWEKHLGGSGRQMRQIWMPGVHSDVGGTGNEFWGRVSFLTMAYYINKLTNLCLDDSLLKRKETKIRNDNRLEAYRINQHRPLPPFSYTRMPSGQQNTNEEYHPVMDLISPSLEYNNKINPQWHEKRFTKVFKPLGNDTQLNSYFQGVLSSTSAQNLGLT